MKSATGCGPGSSQEDDHDSMTRQNRTTLGQREPRCPEHAFARIRPSEPEQYRAHRYANNAGNRAGSSAVDENILIGGSRLSLPVQWPLGLHVRQDPDPLQALEPVPDLTLTMADPACPQRGPG